MRVRVRVRMAVFVGQQGSIRTRRLDDYYQRASSTRLLHTDEQLLLLAGDRGTKCRDEFACARLGTPSPASVDLVLVPD